MGGEVAGAAAGAAAVGVVGGGVDGVVGASVVASSAGSDPEHAPAISKRDAASRMRFASVLTAQDSTTFPGLAGLTEVEIRRCFATG